MSDAESSNQNYKYDYFVNKNVKICPENSEFKPVRSLSPIDPSDINHASQSNKSVWNSIGVWEEKSFEVRQYEQFILQNKGQLKRITQFRVEQVHQFRYFVRQNIKCVCSRQKENWI